MKTVFVGGHSRSGTTLMQGLLCAADGTSRVSREVSYLRGLMEALDLGHRWWGIHTHDHFASPHDLDAFHAELVERWLWHAHQRLGGEVLIQKEPRLTDHFPALGRLLPQARFVVMVRDLRDVVASQHVRTARNGRQLDLAAEVRRWAHTFVRLRESDLGERLWYVRYEALVRQPVETLDTLGRKLGLALVPVARRRWPTRRQPQEESASALDGQPVEASRIGAWKTDLPPGWAEALEGQRGRLAALAGLDSWKHDGEAVFSGFGQALAAKQVHPRAP